MAEIHYTYMGIDPGETNSGYALLSNNSIIRCGIIHNVDLLEMIKQLKRSLTIVYENLINPYKGMRKETVATCKFIGALEYVMAANRLVKAVGYDRVKVRYWVYNAFPEVCVPRVEAKIKYLDRQGERLNRKRYLTKDGVTLRQPSYQFVDDRIVIAAMKSLYGIPDPKPGKSNQYGLKSHSWQALAVAAFYASHNNV